MLLASLFTSALAVLGSVSAAPLEVGADVQLGAESVDTTVDLGLVPRAESEELKAFVANIKDDFNESDETYISRIMDACTKQWPDHNVFETTAVHHYLFWHEEYFQVVVFKCGGFVEKNSGDGGNGNWQAPFATHATLAQSLESAHALSSTHKVVNRRSSANIFKSKTSKTSSNQDDRTLLGPADSDHQCLSSRANPDDQAHTARAAIRRVQLARAQTSCLRPERSEQKQMVTWEDGA
ncbi:hypothetical protein A1Q1_06014 [Trichosporon asahii var. asahii CBS 2479]|uniref:Tyrosinase copper-binding domain-containing protein n=1 Tax=Trichosporon asahii var. asahii (strain ATCC 90039 / CBS 2479 / JCM 2466 / KCTC 7840 / NBRC 103889/ NCYC 2677 / UAMH 7654) TaxID=1186058 RepID=J5Q5H8_TRIAS|nr:hypothetical protein A1Q1_06014 [Trichosporon asahii var. asahii CBS 2479]EJT45568.1 hypothetical protein A1Q1_06014 [Trichosporon asahii var. asahii CBS 2479]